MKRAINKIFILLVVIIISTSVSFAREVIDDSDIKGSYDSGNYYTDRADITVAGHLNYPGLPDPTQFVQKGEMEGGKIATETDAALGGVAPLIYAIMLKVGIAIVLVVIIIWGVMWITAVPQKRAELKASLPSILVGLFILVAGINPAISLLKFMQDLFYSGGTLTTRIENGSGQIAGLVQIIGMAVSLVIILINGVQWVAASPAKRADLKLKLFNILVGIAIILSASWIASGLIGFFNGTR